ncbi:uncharacterized protein LOC110834251 isoform X2 [Zootermopsis nevadensis]|uniref:uncharacterized protein LOC110834251 isoform X2 n=1 Tax=Zootermopsis nevadensis TaxID=136037 RepID=UPI000B8E2B00|nr:uncharacterized protein LOC110834251 isoform X2 [Zootermopsis nevadensis]
MTLICFCIIGALFLTARAEETSFTEPTASGQDHTTEDTNYVPEPYNENETQNEPLHEALAGSYDDGPTESKNEDFNEIDNYPLTVADVNRTIKEVEEILAVNPELPRLSRSEIFEILNNITSQDQTLVPAGESESINGLQPQNYKTHEEYLRAMRALMLVMPYNAKNLSETKIQELYTKAPIIQFIEDNSKEVVTTVRTKFNPSVTTISASTTTEQSEFNEQHFQQEKERPDNHEVYHKPYDTQFIHPDTNYNYETETQHTTLTTEQSSTTKRFKHNYHRRRRPTTSTPDPEQFISQHYKTTKLSPGDQPVTTVYPERISNYKTTDHYYQSAKLSTLQQAVTTVYPEMINLQEGDTSPDHINLGYNVQLQSSLQNKTQLPNGLRPNPSQTRTKPASTITTDEPLSSPEPTGIGLDLPHDMKNLLTSFNVEDHLSDPEPLVHNTSDKVIMFVTPPTADPLPESTKLSSHYSASELTFGKTTTEKTVMRDDVKELLASIGLFPDKERQETVPTTTSTTTTMPDVAAAAESLSSEMKDLLISFGLLPSENDIRQASYQESATEGPAQAYDQQAASPVVNPSSYLSFKPLPLAENESKEDDEDKYLMSSDMKQFLASFGLVSTSDSDEGYPSRGSFTEHGDVHGFRSQKSLKIEAQSLKNSSDNIADEVPAHAFKSNETMPHINMDILTDEMKEILGNLGFLPDTNFTTALSKKKTNNFEGHVFNPSVHLASLNLTDLEAQRLTKLLDTIKKLMKDNGTITQDEIDALNASISFILPPVQRSNETVTSEGDVANVLPVLFVPKKQTNKSLSLGNIKDVPDPLSLEELLLVPADIKNEIKRQQSNNGTSNSSTAESTQDPGPSLTDLADSFGGGETASADTSVVDALPAKRPNGLYFLLDWNTFLDVGDDLTGRKVNLGFNPRVGNSRDFLPVTVP